MSSISDYLTSPDPDFERKRRDTREGMRHWAHEGPFGTTCKDCQSYGFYYEQANGKNVFRNGCSQYFDRMKKAVTVPPGTPSCKYFIRKGETDAPPSHAP